MYVRKRFIYDIYVRCIKRNVCVNLAFFSFDTSFLLPFCKLIMIKGSGDFLLMWIPVEASTTSIWSNRPASTGQSQSGRLLLLDAVPEKTVSV